MTIRDLRGEEIPAGKIERRLRYDGLAATESPAWLSRFGDATESKDDVASSRGELHLDVSDGVGGYTLPRFDAEAFREIRLRVGLRHDISDDGIVQVGFGDDAPTPTAENWCHYTEPGETEAGRGIFVSCGRLSFGRDDQETTTGDLGIVLDASGGGALLELRVRPFERGVTVATGGAGRGDTVYEDADCAFAFGGPVCPTIAVDASESSGTERLSLSTVQVTALHN